ncbi:MAG: hypothetical protein RIS79_3196 [Verrucomicrobiota bacterium]
MASDEAYRLAELKIAEALRSGAKELDLSVPYGEKHDAKRLTELPESLSRLTQLQSLKASHNRLTTLPESLGQLTQLQSLYLASNQLTTLPESLGQLTQLQSLDLANNQLAALPEWLGQLTQLQSLDLSNNQLTALPEFLRQLTQLRSLNLGANRLAELPKWFGGLVNLQGLYLYRNRLVTIPDELSQIAGLKSLELGGNRLGQVPAIIQYLPNLRTLTLHANGIRTLPMWLGDLTSLELLHLQDNQLTDLPTSIVRLEKLSTFTAENNPFNPELAAACEKGVYDVKRYLREMGKGAQKRYEAKLLILGDGNEGKTCVSRALRGLPFRKQVSTRGVDVVPWKVKHPEDESYLSSGITLNIWDFEGQEISHQTHQFFLTSQALYLLVFKCRDLFLMDRAEYWLDTIRARAPKAKVAIVISQCEERSPHVPLDRLEAQYKDLLADEWFFPVGCENEKNIDNLRDFLRRSAAKLEFMGLPWPQTYERAETALKKKAKTKAAHLTRKQLNAILKKAAVSPDNFDGAAGAMERIGVITQFPDCPDLNDFVVIKPQWLTKAISKVMEDGKLSEDKGEIELRRMESIWSRARYDGMFPIFHDCMKEFELCYDLEDHSQCCLVPLRFGYVPPAIPWTIGMEIKTRRMEYKLNIRPPMGIMSRFIVKTHHMIVKTMEHPKGVYWHNGVFLRTHSPVASEALCEFIPDERLLRVEVRAAFPQAMCEQIHGYIQAVFSFFGGLSAERSFGCIKDTDGTESQCKGLHTEKRIYTAIAKERETIDCEFEEHEVDPRLLVSGISSFGGFVEERLAAVVKEAVKATVPDWAEPFLHGVGSLHAWAQANSAKLDQLLHGQATLSAEFKQEAEQKLNEYLTLMAKLLDDRDYHAAPGLIAISTKDRSAWNPVGYFKCTYVLTPFCECEGHVHPCFDGSVEFTRDRAWWRMTSPWIARATKLLSAGLKLGFAGLPLTIGSEAAKAIEDQVKLMEALTEHLELDVPDVPDDTGEDDVLNGATRRDLRSKDIETRLARASLARLLEELAPSNYKARQWGSLSRIRMPDLSYRWLCDACAKRTRK